MTKDTALLRAIALYVDDYNAGSTQYFNFDFAGKTYRGKLEITIEDVQTPITTKKVRS